MWEVLPFLPEQKGLQIGGRRVYHPVMIAETVHCRYCTEGSGESLQMFCRYVPDYPEMFSGSPGQLLPVRCRLARLLSDRLLAKGPDSAVFFLPERQLVLKVYPDIPLPVLLAYGDEIDRISGEFPDSIPVRGRHYRIMFTRILEMTDKSDGSCTMTYSHYAPGANFHEYALTYCRLHTDDVTGFLTAIERDISGAIADYYETRTHSRKRHYIDPRNYKIDFDTGLITVTDLASNIVSFVREFIQP